MTPTLGTEIAGFKLVDGPYTDGAYGIVYKAETQKSNEIVAIKIARDSSDQPNLKRFQQENELLHKLRNHDFIVEPRSQMLCEKTCYLYAMEFLEHDLEEVLVAMKSDNTALKLDIFKNICRGLDHAHGKRIFHRDLHYNNVRFKAGSTQPKITDFGKGKSFELPPLSSQPFNGWGGLVQPPEARFKITDTPTDKDFCLGDIHALGLLLFTLFNAPPFPYKRAVVVNIDYFIQTLNPGDPSQFYQLPATDRLARYLDWLKVYNRGIDSMLNVQIADIDLGIELNKCIKKMCHPDRTLRYQSINEIIEAIESLKP